MYHLLRSPTQARVLSSRLGSLLLLFQRSPIVQMLFPEARVLGGAGLGEVAKWTVATVAGLGAYDTVAGATVVAQLAPNSTAGTTSVTAAVGSPITFIVQCTGAPGTPGSWTMSTVPAGLTHSNSKNSSTDSLSGTPTTAGSYSVTTTAWQNTNATGGSSAKTFTMTVGTAIITTQPASPTISSNTSTTLSVVASGTPITYQWYQGASGVTTAPISGATSASYTTPALTTATNYWVKVTRGTMTTTTNPVVANSTTATVSIGVAPAITTQPTASTTINSGATATLTVAASGTPTPTYQWYVGSPPDVSTLATGTSSTTATYTTPALSTSTSFWVKATNTSGSANSNAAAITVNQPAAITIQPAASTTINRGATATLTVAASGTPTPTYQWYVGSPPDISTPAAGASATTASYTTPALSTSTSFWAKATNSINSANSNAAAITVNQPAAITTHPASATINRSSSTTLSVTASGTGPLTYQWYQGASGTTTTPVGTNSSSYNTGALIADTSYWVKVTNAANVSGALSNTATITVNQPAAISSHPASTTINSGSSTTLSVTATGTGPFTYQWYQGASGTTTTPVGTNSSSYNTGALIADTSYWVKVTNAANANGALSNTAAITVNQPASISSHPASVTINSGSTTTLSVTTTGTGPFTYQWYQGASGTTTTPVGSNSNSYSTGPLTTSTSYWVKVTNAANASGALSNTAVVTITSETFTNWQSAQFTPAQLADPLISGATADPDGDGIPNENEYILGLLPLVSSPSPVPSMTRTSTNLTLSFVAKAASGSGYAGKTRHYAIESIDSFGVGSWTAVTGYQDIVATGQTVTCTTAIRRPHQFYHLRVWLTP